MATPFRDLVLKDKPDQKGETKRYIPGRQRNLCRIRVQLQLQPPRNPSIIHEERKDKIEKKKVALITTESLKSPYPHQTIPGTGKGLATAAALTGEFKQ